MAEFMWIHMNSHKLDFINLINLILVGPTPKRDLRAEVKKIRVMSRIIFTAEKRKLIATQNY